MSIEITDRPHIKLSVCYTMCYGYKDKNCVELSNLNKEEKRIALLILSILLIFKGDKFFPICLNLTYQSKETVFKLFIENIQRFPVFNN